MATTYTENFQFPKLDTGSSNYGSVVNGMLETMDTEIFKAQNPMVNRSGEVLVSLVNGTVMLKKYSSTGGS